MIPQSKYLFRYELIQFAFKYSNKQAAREFKTQPKVVRKWIARYKEFGLNGLHDKSRRPHHSPNKIDLKLERKIIKLRKQTKHKYGARQLIERFNLDCGKSCINRVIKEHHLGQKKKKKKQKRNELWSVKKLSKLFDRIQIDVKILSDLPLYWHQHIKLKLPLYEFTARDVKTGAAFVCYAKKHDSINAATFVTYLLTHLQNIGFDVQNMIIQTDNGAEFNACGRPHINKTPFENAVLDLFMAKLNFIPPASPTWNSDVETFHRLVENEFYDIELIESQSLLMQKMNAYLIDFNYIRKNSYRDNLSPWQLAIQDCPSIPLSSLHLPPILLDDHQSLYFEKISNQPQSKNFSSLNFDFTDLSYDPLSQPDLLRLISSWGGYNVSGFDTKNNFYLKYRNL